MAFLDAIDRFENRYQSIRDEAEYKYRTGKPAVEAYEGYWFAYFSVTDVIDFLIRWPSIGGELGYAWRVCQKEMNWFYREVYRERLSAEAAQEKLRRTGGEFTPE